MDVFLWRSVNCVKSNYVCRFLKISLLLQTQYCTEARTQKCTVHCAVVYCAVQKSAVQYSAVQNSAVQYSAVQHIEVQDCSIQSSSVQ